MAETRAKARALRDAVNVGVASLEETSDADDVPSQPVAQRSGPRRGRANAPVRAVPEASQSRAKKPEDEGEEAPNAPSRGNGSKASRDKARKSQLDLLRTLAEELRGENGVARLEDRIGKSLSELTRAEADDLIDRLTPAENREEAASGR